MQRIKLTKGKSAIIDDDDYERINAYRWSTQVARSGQRFYAVRNEYSKGGSYRRVYMHRFIMDAPEGKEIDHVNGNGLDNRQNNLRVCTSSQNRMNRGPSNASKTGLKGVFKSCGKFIAVIGAKGKVKRLGRFDTPEQAAKAYDKEARKLHGKFASLNRN